MVDDFGLVGGSLLFSFFGQSGGRLRICGFFRSHFYSSFARCGAYRARDRAFEQQPLQTLGNLKSLLVVVLLPSAKRQ